MNSNQLVRSFNAFEHRGRETSGQVSPDGKIFLTRRLRSAIKKLIMTIHPEKNARIIFFLNGEAQGAHVRDVVEAAKSSRKKIVAVNLTSDYFNLCFDRQK